MRWPADGQQMASDDQQPSNPVSALDESMAALSASGCWLQTLMVRFAKRGVVLVALQPYGDRRSVFLNPHRDSNRTITDRVKARVYANEYRLAQA